MEGEALTGMVVFVAIYFIPTMVAYYREHHQRAAIVLLNILLGWTGLGWVGALVWSATAVQHRN